MVSRVAIPLAARIAESIVVAALLFAYGGTDVAPLPRGLASLAGLLGFGFGHGYVSGFVWITLSWLGARLITASLSPAAP